MRKTNITPKTLSYTWLLQLKLSFSSYIPHTCTCNLHICSLIPSKCTEWPKMTLKTTRSTLPIYILQVSSKCEASTCLTLRPAVLELQDILSQVHWLTPKTTLATTRSKVWHIYSTSSPESQYPFPSMISYFQVASKRQQLIFITVPEEWPYESFCKTPYCESDVSFHTDETHKD